ncbi:hypothetical protein BDV09DRAFT_159581 [Aspergillus tetrazonus]
MPRAEHCKLPHCTRPELPRTTSHQAQGICVTRLLSLTVREPAVLSFKQPRNPQCLETRAIGNRSRVPSATEAGDVTWAQTPRSPALDFPSRKNQLPTGANNSDSKKLLNGVASSCGLRSLCSRFGHHPDEGQLSASKAPFESARYYLSRASYFARKQHRAT